MAGWGWTSVTQDTTSVLMEVDLEVQSEEVCEEAFRCSYLQQSMICAGDENGEKSTFRVSAGLGSKTEMRLGLDSQGGSQEGDEGDYNEVGSSG